MGKGLELALETGWRCICRCDWGGVRQRVGGKEGVGDGFEDGGENGVGGRFGMGVGIAYGGQAQNQWGDQHRLPQIFQSPSWPPLAVTHV